MNTQNNDQVFGNTSPQNSQNNIVGFNTNSPFNFNLLNSDFSNATESYIIDDFTIFNQYIHNNLNIRRNIL